MKLKDLLKKRMIGPLIEVFVETIDLLYWICN